MQIVAFPRNIGEFTHTAMYRRMAAVFPYFFRQKAAEGKIHKIRKSAHKKEVYLLNVAKSGTKKNFVTR